MESIATILLHLSEQVLVQWGLDNNIFRISCPQRHTTESQAYIHTVDNDPLPTLPSEPFTYNN